jgi:hypothetical protein
MQIQITTDKNVHGGDDLTRRLEAEFETSLARFRDRITRLDVHLTGEPTVPRRGCVLEARPAGFPAVVVTHHADSVAEACHGAVRKLEHVLETRYGRAWHHKGGESIRHLEVPADPGQAATLRPGSHL